MTEKTGQEIEDTSRKLRIRMLKNEYDNLVVVKAMTEEALREVLEELESLGAEP